MMHLNVQGRRSGEEEESSELTGTSLPTDIDLSFMNGQVRHGLVPSTSFSCAIVVCQPAA